MLAEESGHWLPSPTHHCSRVCSSDIYELHNAVDNKLFPLYKANKFISFFLHHPLNNLCRSASTRSLNYGPDRQLRGWGFGVCKLHHGFVQSPGQYHLVRERRADEQRLPELTTRGALRIERVPPAGAEFGAAFSSGPVPTLSRGPKHGGITVQCTGGRNARHSAQGNHQIHGHATSHLD